MKFKYLLILAQISLLLFFSDSAMAANKVGGKCPKVGLSAKTSNGLIVKCIKSNGKLIWATAREASISSYSLHKWTITSAEIIQDNDPKSQNYIPEKTVKVGDTYRSYFVSRVDGYLSFSESKDGYTYTNQVRTNLKRTSEIGGENTFMDHPVVLPLKNGKYLLIYDICTGDYNVPPSLPRRLVSRISDDGINWGPGNLIPAPKASGLNPEGKIFDSVPTPIQLASGLIRVYYVQGGASIGSATSSDNGLSWKVDDGFRLGTPYGPSKKQNSYIDPVVFQEADGTVYLYFGFVTDWNCMETSGTPKGCIPLRMAGSKDGIKFTEVPGNVLTPQSGATQYADPDIFIGPDGEMKMLFADVSNNGKFLAKVRLASRIK